MARNPRYDILFEPVKIGPVTAPQPLLCGAACRGHDQRHAAHARRLPRDQGRRRLGRGVHRLRLDHPSSDDSPLPFATLWDENDIRSHALMTEAVHRHGALAGIELWHGGGSVMNRTSRIPPLSPSGTAWMATHVELHGQPAPAR